MNIRDALKGQYTMALRMLRQSVERCPGEIWVAGENPRAFWQIVLHSVFYAHLYMGQNEAAFSRWPGDRGIDQRLWGDPVADAPYTREQLMDYIDWVLGQVDATIDGLDLDSENSGFDWYPGISKLEHEIMSIRHIQGHVGQLSELLMMHGIDTDWMGRRK